MQNSARNRRDIRTLLAVQRLWAKLVDWSQSSGLRLDKGFCRFVSFLALPKFIFDFPLSDAFRLWSLAAFGGNTGQVRLERSSAPLLVRGYSSDPFVFATIFSKKCYQSVERCKDVKYILDAGAYVGYSGVFLAKMFPNATIVCLEPESSNYALLKKNTAAFPNIIAVNQALWTRDEELNLSSDEEIERNDHWGVQVHSGRSEVAIKNVMGRSISSLSKEFGVEKWDIMKIDIEGAEAGLFDESMRAYIANAQRVFVELHEHMVSGSAESFFQMIDALSCDLAVEDENVVFSPIKSAS